MVHSRDPALPAGRRLGAPQKAPHCRSGGVGEASTPKPPEGACGPRRNRRICPESRPFSALLRAPSGSTLDPRATTLGVAFRGPVSRPSHRPPPASRHLEKPLARSGKPVGDLGVQRSFYVDDLGSNQRPNPSPDRPLDKCSHLPGYHQHTHTRRSPFNAIRPFTTRPFITTCDATPLRSPQFRVPLTVKKNLSKGTMGKTLQPYPFPYLPPRGLPA